MAVVALDGMPSAGAALTWPGAGSVALVALVGTAGTFDAATVDVAGFGDDLPRMASQPTSARTTTPAAMAIGTIEDFFCSGANGGTYAAAAGSAAIGTTGAMAGADPAAGLSWPGSRTGSGSACSGAGIGAGIASEVDRRCM